jgi:Pyruvate/2-oxoacid:ferredoxin oxidoreductase gamma subunit
MILLGTFSAFSEDLFQKEALRQCILRKSKKKGLELNLKAFETGYQEALQRKGTNPGLEGRGK